MAGKLVWYEACKACKEFGDYELNFKKFKYMRMANQHVCAGCKYMLDKDLVKSMGDSEIKLDWEHKTLNESLEAMRNKAIAKKTFTNTDKFRFIEKYVRLHINYYRLNDLGLKKIKSMEEDWVKLGCNENDLVFYKKYKRDGLSPQDTKFYSDLDKRLGKGKNGSLRVSY